MPEIDINDLSSIGVIQDQPGYQLPPEAWTTMNNFRVTGGGVEKLPGWTPTLGTNPRTSSDTPLFTMYVSGPTQAWWLWASNAHMYVFDGVNDTDITRAVGGNYNAADAFALNGTIFQGIPIINTGSDKPQFWATYSAGQKMQDLTNWPATLLCRVIRSFKSYLVALNLTTGGVAQPHNLRWSTAAVPGSLPATWDFTDPTQDAGVTSLPDVASGQIMDGMELGGQFYIYKENAVWRMQFIGGRFIFGFFTFLENAGLLSTRCVDTTGDGLWHVFASQDDIIRHNGVTAESLLSKRLRRYLFNQIDPAHYNTSFMFGNPVYDEMWFCYPTVGALEPTRALIWNYKYNVFTEADIDFRHASIGTVQTAGVTWAQQTLNWNQDTADWANSKRRRIVLSNPTTKKLLLLDDGTARDGVAFNGLLQRLGLSIIGRKRNGEWIEDFQHRKMVQMLWPKFQANSGQPVNVRVGYQQTVNGGVAWNGYQTFDPNTQVFVQGCEGDGRSVAVEFNSNNFFRADGYKLAIVKQGMY